jgi:hypothetical protein
MQAPTIIQASIAVDAANRIRTDMQWSSEVSKFLSVLHLHDGILVPQPPLDFVVVDTEDLPVDVGAVKERWPLIRISKKLPTEETPEAEQLRRMLGIFEALDNSRAQLRQQLSVLNHG